MTKVWVSWKGIDTYETLVHYATSPGRSGSIDTCHGDTSRAPILNSLSFGIAGCTYEAKVDRLRRGRFVINNFQMSFARALHTVITVRRPPP